MREPLPGQTTGFPSPASDFDGQSIDLNRLLNSNPTATFPMQVTNNAMSGAGIIPGDIVLVDRSVLPTLGSMVVLWHVDGLIIRYLRRQGPYFYLATANHLHHPFIFHQDDDLKVWGVVVGVVRRIPVGKSP